MGVESFGDIDEFFERHEKRMEQADARVKPWQAEIKPGDYFVRNSPHGFNIYGEILEEEEPRDKHLQYYRLCRGYSVACPEGEMGDIHVSQIEALISRETFEAMRKRGWS